MDAAQKQGIKEISEIIVAGGGLLQGYKAAKADGKLDFGDLGLLLPLMPKLSAAIENAGGVVPEFKDLDAEEAQELLSLVGGQIGGIDPALQVKVEKTLLALKAVYEAYKAWA